MKTSLLILFNLLLIIFSLLSQEQKNIIIKGSIIESDTYSPIPYANIYLKKSKTGTMSDSLGNFELEINENHTEDSLFVSSIGYTKFGEKISNIDLDSKLTIELNDSLFLLDEAVALAYDHFKALYWNTGKKSERKLLITCATRSMLNIASFVKILTSEYGQPKANLNIFKWNNVKIKGAKEKKLKITLTYMRCKSCPGKKDLNITIGIRNKRNKDVLKGKNEEEFFEKYFQALLDETFAQGIDYSLLESRNKIAYLKNDDTPYSGKCFGYYKTGEKGLKGTYVNGIKTGHWTYWYKNGQVKMEVDYLNGKKHGEWYQWWDNGNLRIKAIYNNGKLNGHNKYWYENGTLKKESFYVNGIFYGYIEYDQKGNVVDKKGNMKK